MILTKRRMVLIGIPIALILMGIGAFLLRGGDSAAASDYFTAPVEEGALRNVVNATGTVQTVVTVQVGSQVSGQIEELYADFNSIVKRGQLLAKLDFRNFEAQVQNSRASVLAAEAGVRSAEAEIKTQAASVRNSKANAEAARATRDHSEILFDRAKELTDRGVASKNDYDNARANAESERARYEQALASIDQAEAQATSTDAQLEQAKAQLQQALADLNRSKLNLEYASIFSPVDGVVISRQVDVGQTIAASMQSPTLFAIATDLSRLQVSASVDEADIGSISDAANVQFSVDAYPNETFRGKIAEIRLNSQTVQNVVTYSVILAIENPELKLKPGMTANISITVDQRQKAIKVPNAAIRYTPPGTTRPPETTTAPNVSQEGHGVSTQPSMRRETAAEEERTAFPLAPGQKWDPGDKIRFGNSQGSPPRSGRVWILNPQGRPEPREIVLGMTDGSATEVVSGALKQGDLVIIGDMQLDNALPADGFGPFGFGGRGGGSQGGGGARGQ